jgi:hypothetical protein
MILGTLTVHGQIELLGPSHEPPRRIRHTSIRRSNAHCQKSQTEEHDSAISEKGDQPKRQVAFDFANSCIRGTE